LPAATESLDIQRFQAGFKILPICGIF